MSPQAAALQPDADPGEADLDRAIEELRGVLKEEDRRTAQAPQRAPSAGSVIMGIPVEVQIVLGSAEMSVAELMALGKGSTVALDRRIGEPVEMVVNGRRVARGEITVLDEDPSRFGIRLTEIITETGGA
ncbi:MAG: flagellar motor switch protein FliN [Mesorhizobium amorphae]|nr:MAG: flagellar motor switch protein FliN [Mesorhizobium amorphae]